MRKDHLPMERQGSIRKPADQAPRHNSSKKDRPQPEKQAGGSERHWGLLPERRCSTPLHPSAALGRYPNDSLWMPKRNQRYVDIGAVSEIVIPRLIWRQIMVSRGLSSWERGRPA
jgi:hypothetical protein